MKLMSRGGWGTQERLGGTVSEKQTIDVIYPTLIFYNPRRSERKELEMEGGGGGGGWTGDRNTQREGELQSGSCFSGSTEEEQREREEVKTRFPPWLWGCDLKVPTVMVNK